MVYRIYVEKKKYLEDEAKSLCEDIRTFLGVKALENIRILNRYDVENIDRDLFEKCKMTVFAEPQLDNITYSIDNDGSYVFGVEFLPGQFDQRADSAAQCIQIISQKERPDVRTAKIYMLYGKLTDDDKKNIKKYVINPVEAREASLDEVSTLKMNTNVPTEVEVLNGFINFDKLQLEDFLIKYGLAMDIDDLSFCQEYFLKEKRDPTITEIRMIDTYWSDHCRHTTFLTTIDSVNFEDELLQEAFDKYISIRKSIGRTKPINLMDIATIAVKYLKKQGKLDKLDESEEINACTVKIQVESDAKSEPWLLLFKNETHNHPTEIEPFGGAATCIGGAIRDPLSGRSYVYAAMRVTGAADPLKPIDQTLPGKLPQRKIVTTAAAGYSSYGNQIGLATGQVDEIYHDGYAAKRMEIGAVIAATPAQNVRRECPIPGDIIILLGGKTGRDGCGGATGSSKSHNLNSLVSCGAEVQKGNAPEERKLQRLFRNSKACKMIKRCNDFGAGGVSVAIGELAEGLDINLNAVPKKYEGLDGTELAISESQERMAVVVSKEDVFNFLEIAAKENIEATVVASVKAEPRLTMSWNGKNIVDVSREFLDSNGAEKHIDISTDKLLKYEKNLAGDFIQKYKTIAQDLNICSKRGLSERFDSTVGAGTVLMPFGGKYQLTPIQAMVHKISMEKAHTSTCSMMAWGFNPYISEKSPYHGAYLAVVESICKLVATGAEFSDVYLSFQEYFKKPLKDGKRWGQPLSALLGAFEAQLDYGVGAIGGKDSMSGTFEKIDVPPTLVSFAVTTENIDHIVSPEFKHYNSKVILIKPKYLQSGLPDKESLLSVFEMVHNLIVSKKAISVYTPGYGGIAESIMKMAFGNKIGFKYDEAICENEIFEYSYGSFILELAQDCNVGTTLGMTVNDSSIIYKNSKIELDNLLNIYENKLEKVYPCNIKQKDRHIPSFSYSNDSKINCPYINNIKPKIIIPVFPGTNCEYDSQKAMLDAGADTEIIVINNLNSEGIIQSAEYFAKQLKQSQMVFIPGGFSGGDEPDGSGKFITAFFRNSNIKNEINELLETRKGLMCGICNGFQALIKLGLVPYGEIIDTNENCPTLTYNTIRRHQSKIVRTRIASNKSPWLSHTCPGEVYYVPISHGEGKFIANDDVIKNLAENGQIATQYVDMQGNPSSDVRYNPNDSAYAIEGITSPDGRVLGKMGHSERIGNGLYKNVPGTYDIQMFRSAVEYFK